MIVIAAMHLRGREHDLKHVQARYIVILMTRSDKIMFRIRQVFSKVRIILNLSTTPSLYTVASIMICVVFLASLSQLILTDPTYKLIMDISIYRIIRVGFFIFIDTFSIAVTDKRVVDLFIKSYHKLSKRVAIISFPSTYLKVADRF